MIKNTINFDKNKFYKKQSNTLMLLTLEGQKIKDKEEEKDRIPLNLSIAIDISGSMDLPIKQEKFPSMLQNMAAPFTNKNLNPFSPIIREILYVKKIHQAKKAAIQAIETMQDNDWISIVAFDSKSQIIVPATQLNKDNREDIIRKINGLTIGNSTNLHEGWLTSATEVAKNISTKTLNRVLILTDGETNCGVMDADQIATNVSKLLLNSISTSTFGIGSDFNEDLLQAMSNSGGGNFYYIDDENKLSTMFYQEFTGMSNLAASEIYLSFSLNEGFEIKEQLNKLNMTNGKYLIPSLADLQKIFLLFKLDLTINNKADIGFIYLEFKDHKGKIHQQEIELKGQVISKKIWDTLPEEHEIKIQKALLDVANNKLLMTQALDKGDRNLANQLISESQAFLGTVGISDPRLHKEQQILNDTLQSAKNMQNNEFRKTLSTQSYQTRYSKD